MKILYDHQIFTSQKYGGISRYFYELVRELDAISDIQYEIPLLVSNNHYISDKKFWNKITCSAYHQPSPQIFSYEIKVKAQ